MESGRIGWVILWDLFWSFFKIGPVTFGGGYAMIPLFEQEVVHKHNWVKAQDIAEVFAVAQSIPGAIAINSATFIGYRIAGIRGALAAMIGVMLPTFFIVLMLCFTYVYFKDNSIIKAAFTGIRPAIVAFIVYAGINIGRTAILDKATLITAAVTLAMLLFFNRFIHPVAIIAGGVLAGIVLMKLKEKLGYAIKLESAYIDEFGTHKYSDYYIGDGI